MGTSASVDPFGPESLPNRPDLFYYGYVGIPYVIQLRTGPRGERLGKIRPIPAAITALGVVMLTLVGYGVWHSGSISDDRPGEAPPSEHPAGFTFFDVGVNTQIDDALRRDLQRQLGSDAIAYRLPISLDFNYKGFLADHFPEIDRVNRALNAPLGERKEHDTLVLMYRRAHKKETPFDYVELVFSNHTKRPLLFRIEPAGVGPAILDALIEKYGPPRTIQWSDGEAKTLWWEDHTDLLLATVSPNRFGTPVYRFRIVFTRNIETMLKREIELGQKRDQERRKAGEKAF